MNIKVSCLFAGLGSFHNCLADDLSNSEWDKRFLIRAGVIDYDLDGKLSSTKEGNSEVKMDLDDLDLDEDRTVPYLSLHARLTNRWRV
jgi:hypothetical protein